MKKHIEVVDRTTKSKKILNVDNIDTIWQNEDGRATIFYSLGDNFDVIQTEDKYDTIACIVPLVV